MSDSRKPGWITRAALAAVALTGAYGFLEETTIRTTIAAAVLSGFAAFHLVAAFKILRQKARPRTAAAASEVALDSSVVARVSVPLVRERAASQTRADALAEIGRGDWASAKAGLRWFVGNATGEQDWQILAEGLRFPNNLAPQEIAAEALIRRYGTEGLNECLRYLDREDVEGNTYWTIQSLLDDLYLVEDIPIRTMLLEISTVATYNDQKLLADELLAMHNLSADAQGALKNPAE
ncbi:hypothetical protein PXH69_28805 [Rhodococcus qingshengii]|uniref:Uncharacterized protein n=1 Tax=Rhodococcus qingshengii TaxID=334542 RepID=A0AAW6LP59_RHOSG|nr:hypothetical protein [Rhodococcus qingshengii]MDE8648978.1 hypothetical protein [Rhodococcus qingshengii]